MVPGSARLLPGSARFSGASRADSDHQPSRAGHQDGIRLVKEPNSLKLLLQLTTYDLLLTPFVPLFYSLPVATV